jgi:hypothetical protein
MAVKRAVACLAQCGDESSYDVVPEAVHWKRKPDIALFSSCALLIDIGRRGPSAGCKPYSIPCAGNDDKLAYVHNLRFAHQNCLTDPLTKFQLSQLEL